LRDFQKTGFWNALGNRFRTWRRKKKKEELDDHERKRLLEVKARQKKEERALEKRKQVEEKMKEKDKKRKEESEKRDREAERSRRSSGYVRRDLVEDLGGKIPLLKDNQSFHLARLTDKFEKEQERKRKSRVRLSSPKKTVRERLGPRTSPEPAQEDILGAHVDINLLGQFLELIQYYSMNILRSFLPAI